MCVWVWGEGLIVLVCGCGGKVSLCWCVCVCGGRSHCAGVCVGVGEGLIVLVCGWVCVWGGSSGVTYWVVKEHVMHTIRTRGHHHPSARLG